MSIRLGISSVAFVHANPDVSLACGAMRVPFAFTLNRSAAWVSATAASV